jgi:hypothetical protein
VGQNGVLQVRNISVDQAVTFSPVDQSRTRLRGLQNLHGASTRDGTERSERAPVAKATVDGAAEVLAPPKNYPRQHRE